MQAAGATDAAGHICFFLQTVSLLLAAKSLESRNRPNLWPKVRELVQVDAAWLAAKRGVTTVIASGKGGDSILKVVAGQLVGTMFSCDAGASLWEAHERASR